MLESSGWEKQRELECEAKGELSCSKGPKGARAGEQGSEVKPTRESFVTEREADMRGNERNVAGRAAGRAIAVCDAAAQVAPARASDAAHEAQRRGSR
jgi:hypothetical protein